MKFGRPEYAWLLLLAPALALFYVFVLRRKREAMARFAWPRLMDDLISGVSVGKQRAKPILTVAAVCLMVLALLEPMWGYHQVKVQRQGVDIVVAVDTSRSMLAEDVKPSRIEKAKQKIIDLLRLLQGDRVALVAFAGQAYIKCPLTEDYDTVEMLLKDVDVGVIPEGSTAIGNAIRRGIQAFCSKERKHKVMVLITDGEDHGEDPIPDARAAGEEGIVLFTVGIGTPEGEYIWIAGEGEKRTRLQDAEGNYVKSRLDAGLLTKLCETANAARGEALASARGEAPVKGCFIPAYSPDWGLEKVYNEMIGGMEKKQMGLRWVKKYHNRYQWPLLLAMVALAAEALMGEGKRDAARRRKRRWNETD